jgi:hypothetical protein
MYIKEIFDECTQELSFRELIYIYIIKRRTSIVTNYICKEEDNLSVNSLRNTDYKNKPRSKEMVFASVMRF